MGRRLLIFSAVQLSCARGWTRLRAKLSGELSGEPNTSCSSIRFTSTSASFVVFDPKVNSPRIDVSTVKGEWKVMLILEMSLLVFVLVFGGSLAGMAIRRILPEAHFEPEARDAVRLAIGLVVTMTGLVLGMLVSSARTFYEGEKNQVAQMSSDMVLLTDLLAAYGPETAQDRTLARQFVQEAVERIWPTERSQVSQLRPGDTAKEVYQHIEALVPKNDAQKAMKAELMSVTVDLRKSYWLMYLQTEQPSIAIPLLGVVTSWLVVIFVSFGLLAPRNATVFVTLIVCALAVSAAIFIIMSMYSPFQGVLKIPPTAVHDAMSQMAEESD